MRHKEESTGPNTSNSVSFWYQICTIGLTAIILGLTLYRSMMTPTPREYGHHVDTLTANMVDMQAVQPVQVLTGMTISRYRAFDMIHNQFVFEGTVWFEYDPALLSIETISNFFIDRADIKKLSEPRAKMVDGKLLVRYDVLVNFSALLDYSLFPVDDHRLSLVMTNNRVTPQDIVFICKSQNFDVVGSAENFGWRRLDHRVIEGVISKTVTVGSRSVTIQQPAVEFVVTYGRTGIRYMLVLILPMFVLLVIMLSTFSYDSRTYFSSMVATNGAALSGLIGFRFVIESMSPVVGYFMLSDVYFMTFLCAGACIFLMSIFSRAFTLWMRYAVLSLIHIILNVIFVCIMFYVLQFS
jgi:hypothetical protein